MAPLRYTFNGYGSLSQDYIQAGITGSSLFPAQVPPQQVEQVEQVAQQQEEQLPPPPPSPASTETTETLSVATLNSDVSTAVATPQSPMTDEY